MNVVLPLTVAVPLAGAALLAATDQLLPEWVKEYPAMLVAAATSVLTILVLTHTQRTDALHWFGGWQPRHGVSIGIDFATGPLGAGFAALSSVLVTAALVFSWHYMQEAPRLFRVLMLVFCAGMNGFAFSGDLFNMFVWFELLGVATYALAGYQVEQLGPLQGAVNFAITNSVGSFALLFGTALLYGRTGALNFAQVGHALEGRHADGLLVVAFTLIVAGFFVKSALVPFHLWLADTYAVSPAPVCLIFAGVLSEVGLFGLARVYWTVFEAPFGSHARDVRNVLLAVGIATALLGALMAFLQRHLKRLLAYTVISHVGLTLIGIGLLDAKSLAGAANLVLSHAFIKGGLFLGTGVLLRELGSVDELRLHGRAGGLRVLGIVFGLGAVGLAGTPYLGTFLGHSLLDDGARADGFGWIPPVVMVAAGLSSAAMLRAFARIFLGWGPTRDTLLTEEPREEPPEEQANRPIMVGVTASLVVLGLLLSIVPGLQDRSDAGARRFVDRHAYIERVLHGKVRVHRGSPAVVLHAAGPTSIAYGLGGLILAVGLAWFGLHRQRAPGRLREAAGRALGPPISALKGVHSGVVGDYVAWVTVGTAVLGGVWALTLARGP
jgi:multicomponent Na+:H+ antiporter subunit D